MQRIERGLQRGDRLRVSRCRTRFERFERGLHLVTQIAHRAEPCHPGAALQGVEDALQLDYRAGVGAVASPTAEHGVRLLEQLVASSLKIPAISASNSTSTAGSSTSY